MNIQLKNAPTEGTRHGDPRLAVTYRPIAELKLDPRNPRCHAPKQIRQIAQSLTVLVGEGNFNAGIVRMREAMSTLREVGGELIHSYALSLLTESYLRAREPEKGLTGVAEALKGIEAGGQRMHEAEI